MSEQNGDIQVTITHLPLGNGDYKRRVLGPDGEVQEASYSPGIADISSVLPLGMALEEAIGSPGLETIEQVKDRFVENGGTITFTVPLTAENQ